MSGNTSETRCKRDEQIYPASTECISGQHEDCSGSGPLITNRKEIVDCKCKCHEPTPPEGEAVAEQKCERCDRPSKYKAAELDADKGCWIHWTHPPFLGWNVCSAKSKLIGNKWVGEPAPVVSTAAPEPPQICKHCQEEISREGIYWRSVSTGGRCCDLRTGHACPLVHEPVGSVTSPAPDFEVDFSIDSDQRCRAKKQGTEAIQHDGLRCARKKNHSGECRFEGLPVCSKCGTDVTIREIWEGKGGNYYAACPKCEPVAPESYKPAEGPDFCECPNPYEGARPLLTPRFCERCKKPLKLAATPVTVEAPGCEHGCMKHPTSLHHMRDGLMRCNQCEADLLATPKPIGDVEAVAGKLYGQLAYVDIGMVDWLKKAAAILSPFFAPAGPENKVTQQEIDETRTNDQPPDLDWDKVHALLEPWEQVWEGDKNKYLGRYPEWMVNAAAELFAHDICDKWSWNDYVAAATVIISRHFPAQPPCSECATLQEKLEIAQRYGQREYAIEQILRGDLSTAVAECATLRKERDEARSELFISGVELTKQRSLAIVARLNAALWQGKLQAAEAQLSTLRDALENIVNFFRSNWSPEEIADMFNPPSSAIFAKFLIQAEAALAPTPEVAPVKGPL